MNKGILTCILNCLCLRHFFYKFTTNKASKGIAKAPNQKSQSAFFFYSSFKGAGLIFCDLLTTVFTWNSDISYWAVHNSTIAFSQPWSLTRCFKPPTQELWLVCNAILPHCRHTHKPLSIETLNNGNVIITELETRSVYLGSSYKLHGYTGIPVFNFFEYEKYIVVKAHYCF